MPTDRTAAEQFTAADQATHEAFAHALVAEGREFALAVGELNRALHERSTLRALAVREAMYAPPQPLCVTRHQARELHLLQSFGAASDSARWEGPSDDTPRRGFGAASDSARWEGGGHGHG